MQITKNFSLAEMVKSSKAVELGLDNTPSPEVVGNLVILCQAVLQPIRDHYNKSVDVQSGYRSANVNTVVGGSKTSDHCKGMAADIEIAGVNNLDLATHISKNCRFTQLILEFHREEIPDSGWIHVSYNKNDLKGQILTAFKKDGKTMYLPGLRLNP